MQLSRRKYYSNLLIAMLVMGVLILIGAPIINKYIFQLKVIDKIIKYMILGMVIMIAIIITIQLIANKGIRGLVRKYELLNTMESNLISIGAFKKIEGKNYVVLPKIKIKENDIIIKLDNIKIRTIIERYLNSFSTALPSKYIVEDYYISQNNAEVIIKYEDIKNYIREEYSIAEYKKKIQCTDMLDLYFDKKHIVNVNDYPHFLVSGSSGSGKSYFVNEIVIQAIIKGWEIVVVDLKKDLYLQIVLD